MHRRRQMHQTCPGAQWYPVFEGECDMRVPQVSERIKEAPAQALRGVFAGIGQLLLITDKLKNKASHQEMPRARTPGAPGTVTDTTVTSRPGQAAAAAPAGSATETTPAAAAPAAPAPAPAETVAAKPAAAEPAAARPATARRPAAKPAAGKPVTPKPGAKPVTAKPPTARRPAAKAAPTELAGQPPPKPPKQQSTRDFDKTGNVRLLGAEKDSPASGAATPATPEPAPAATGEAPLPHYDELSVASLRARLRNLDVTQVRQLAEYERAHAARADVLTMFERRIAKLEAEA
jgi:hypothetical protein